MKISKKLERNITIISVIIAIPAGVLLLPNQISDLINNWKDYELKNAQIEVAKVEKEKMEADMELLKQQKKNAEIENIREWYSYLLDQKRELQNQLNYSTNLVKNCDISFEEKSRILGVLKQADVELNIRNDYFKAQDLFNSVDSTLYQCGLKAHQIIPGNYTVQDVIDFISNSTKVKENEMSELSKTIPQLIIGLVSLLWWLIPFVIAIYFGIRFFLF